MIFQGMNILVTGASSGIGRQIAIDLSAAGANLVLLGRDFEKLQETRKLCISSAHVLLIAKDLKDEDATDFILDYFDFDLNGIVLNAGKTQLKPLPFINRQEIDELFSVNVRSNMLIIQALLRKRQIKKGASIVFISSIATIKPSAGISIYNMSKSALNGFAHSLALEVSGKKIRVNTILPGIVETNLLGRERSEDETNSLLSKYPLGRFGTPADISSLTCFLLSDQASWITGAQIPIDGGFSMI
jgi:NAD(P)-dependent dehydrogenase (short-subunit alcohol dehydrogenase family)